MSIYKAGRPMGLIRSAVGANRLKTGPKIAGKAPVRTDMLPQKHSENCRFSINFCEQLVLWTVSC